VEDLEFLESYLLTEYDVDVVWGRDEVDAYYYDADSIGINTSRDKELQLFCLLHEAGHVILRKQGQFDKEFPFSLQEGRTQLSRVDTVREEIRAWEEGKNLACKLGIHLNEQRWERYWRHQVYKYIKWAANKKK